MLRPELGQLSAAGPAILAVALLLPASIAALLAPRGAVDVPLAKG